MIQKIIFLYFALLILSVSSAAAEPFKVGIILALSGPAAANGISMQNSIKLAMKDNPGNFANIKFIYEDAAYDPKQAVAAFIKLKDQDKVNLFYVWGISFCKPIAPLAEAAKVAVICQGIEQASYMNNKYLLRFMNSTAEYGELLLSYIRAQKWKNIGMVLTEHAYIEGILKALQQNLSADETIKVIDSYPTGPVEMRSTVTKIKQQKLDALGVFLTPGQIGQFYKLLAEQKINTATFGTNYFENFDELKLGAGAMVGAVYVHNLVSSSFLERYENTYHNKSQLAFGAMAYEFAALVGELFNQKGEEFSAEKIIEKFSEVKTKEGKATGNYQFIQTPEGDRYFRFPIVLKEVSGEQYKILRQ